MTDDLYVKCPACGGTGKHLGRAWAGLGDCGTCNGERYVPVGVSRGEVRAVVSHLAACKDDGATNGGAVYIDDSAFLAARELLAKLADDTPDSQKPNLSEGMDELRARYHQYFDDKPDGWPRNEND